MLTIIQFMMISSNIEPIIMQKFKLQQLRSDHLPNQQWNHNNSKISTSQIPILKLSISQIGYLNYPIQSLISIVQEHFEEEPPSANIVCKALKIISISLKDQQLKNSLDKIILKNKEKRQSLFLFAQYWVTFTKGNKLPSILSKFHPNVARAVAASTISCYFFNASDSKHHLTGICEYIQNYMQTISKVQNGVKQFDKLIGDIKNDFLLIDFSLQNLLRKSPKFGGQSMQRLFKQLLPWVFEKENCQKQMSEIVHSYIEIIKSKQFKKDSHKNYQNTYADKFETIEEFFMKFMYLSENFTKKLQKLLTGELVMTLWMSLMNKNSVDRQDEQNTTKIKLEPLIKSAIKEYINTSKIGKQFWDIFSGYYGKPSENYTIPQVKYQLLGLATELNNQNLLTDFIVKIYLYNYFVGKNFEIESESNFVKQYLSQNNSLSGMVKHKIAHQSFEGLSQMLHGIENCSSKGGINVITINKIYAVQNWPKIQIFSKQFEANLKIIANSVTNFDSFFTKLKAIFKKIEQKCEKKGQNIQLTYNVLIVKDLQTNNEFKVTLDQIQLYGKIKESDKFKDSIQKFKLIYEQTKTIQDKGPIQKQQKQEQHPIVLEAKTIKLLKKSKKSLLLQEISREMGQKTQKMEAILRKLINRGFVDQDENQKFCYLA